MKQKIAAIIPCYNEELTIGKVIKDIKDLVPEALVYVCDNNSTDRTYDVAKSAGASVFKENKQGKGFVVQTLFDKVDADIYVMVDGDDTYDLTHLREMVSSVINGNAVMVVGRRLPSNESKTLKQYHPSGNIIVKFLVNTLFRANLKDIMSGFRIMDSLLVKNINIVSQGFEVETEMTIKALKRNYLIKEVDIDYKERPNGSYSKFRTLRDGLKIVKTIILLFIKG